MIERDLHVERPTRVGGKTYCACGSPWPCPRSDPDNDRLTANLIDFDERTADPRWCRACGASDGLPDGSCAECGAPPVASDELAP
jgi:hypothetical protein